jgi:hypothetical protein
MLDDLDNMERRWDDREAKIRPKAAARLRARKIVEQANWLWRPLIYWDGVGPSFKPSIPADCRSLAQVVVEKLSGLPPGLYFVNTSQALGITPVDARFLAGISYQALVASRRFALVLCGLVGDVGRWRNEVSARLGRIRAALEASRVLRGNGPETLILEGSCLWLGSDARRPSRLIDTATIRDWPMQKDGATAPGAILGSLVLGQRNSGSALPPHLRGWRNVGQLLANWPPDLVAAFLESDFNRISNVVRACGCLNSCDAWHAALDYRLTSPNASLFALVAALPPVLEQLQQYHREPQRRWGKLVHHLSLAFDRAPALGLAQALADVLRETTENRGLEFPSDGDTLCAVESACRWFLGVGLPPEILAELWRKIDRNPRKDIWPACREAVIQALAGIRETIQGARDWSLIASALAGRLAARGEIRATMIGLAAWLEHCRTAWIPSTEDAFELAYRGVADGTAASKTADDLEQFLGSLGQHGATLLNKSIVLQWQKNRKRIVATPTAAGLQKELSDKLAILGQLGFLTDEQVGQVIACDYYRHVRRFLRSNRPALHGFLDWLQSNSQADSDIWADVFELRTPGLVSALTHWIQRIVRDGSLCWTTAEEFIGALPGRFLEGGEDGERQERHAFLLQAFWIMDRIVLELDSTAGADHCAIVRRIRLVEIAYYWKRNGYCDLECLLDSLLNYCKRLEADNQKKTPWNEVLWRGDDLGLMVELSAGHVGRFLNLLEHLSTDWKHPEDPRMGWRLLAGWTGAQDFVSSCTERSENIPRLFHLLKRLALLSRLPVRDFFDEWMQTWLSPVAEPLERLRMYRAIAGHTSPYPKAIARVLGRPNVLEHERSALERQERDGVISCTARVRLEKLRNLSDNPERLANWIERDLRTLLIEQEQAARLEALESVVRLSIRRHWESLLGPVNGDLESPDWDNALRLWHSVNENRRLLKHLLRREAQGDRKWILERPPNRAFIEKMRQRNIRLDAWIGPRERQYIVRGRRFTVRVETDPLKVLWMGRLFGTCLSPEGVNAFSTLANAVEVNKCVLYLHDDRGRIIGRKLLAMSHDGVVFGFQSYGNSEPGETSGGSPWVKLLFEVVTLDLVLLTGARFSTSEEEKAVSAEEIQKRFHLFAKWYFDGYEPFDGWTRELAALATPYPDDMRHALLENVTSLFQANPEAFARDNGETIRALLEVASTRRESLV